LIAEDELADRGSSEGRSWQTVPQAQRLDRWIDPVGFEPRIVQWVFRQAGGLPLDSLSITLPLRKSFDVSLPSRGFGFLD
jgi:hypothetical protein